jgi:hypothetical protein
LGATDTCSYVHDVQTKLIIMQESLFDTSDLSGVVLVKDCLEAPGSFLLTQVLELALSNNFMITCVSLARGARHYQQLLRKLGINMSMLIETRQLVFLDVLHSLRVDPRKPTQESQKWR